MADQDYPNLYADMEASAQRTRAAAVAFEHVLGGPAGDTVPVNGYLNQPTIAGRVKARLDPLVESIESAAESVYRFAGYLPVAPTTRVDGSPLQGGDEYQNSVTGIRYSWTGSAWTAPTADTQVLVQDLASKTDPNKGSGMIGFLYQVGAVGRTLLSKLQDYVTRADFTSDAAFNSAKPGKLSLDGTGRLRSPSSFIAGTEEVSGSTARDAYIVGRTLSGPTDCHAFADRTVMVDVNDYGGYGTFDATTEIRHDGLHNHGFSFQDRFRYSGNGAGILERQFGFYSRPELRGNGRINERHAIHIYDVTNSGGGTVGENVGVFVENLLGITKVAMTILQTQGYTIYAPGGAPMHHTGRISVGKLAAAQTANGIEVTGLEDGAPTAFLDSSAALGVILGTGADKQVTVVSGGAIRMRIFGSAGDYGVCPGSANPQPLGKLDAKWSSVYSEDLRPGTGTARWSSGAGNPEGVVAAPPGSLWTNTAGGANTTLFVKASGTGNTGWVAK